MMRSVGIVAVVTLTLLLTGPPGSAASARKLAPRAHRNYMAFGDSITAGFGTNDPESLAYPDRANVRGFGVAGSCVVQPDVCPPEVFSLTWWPTYLGTLDHRPRTAIWLVGINDLGHRIAAVDVIAGLRRIRRVGLRDWGIRTVFGTITPAPENSVWRVMESQRRLVNRWIRTQPRHVDYAAALECRRAKVMCPRFVSPDWQDIHPGDAGAKALGRTLLNWIVTDRNKRRT